MNKTTVRLFRITLGLILLALALLPAACGGASRSMPTAIPPDVVRPGQPTPDFSDSADLFYLERATPVASATLPPPGAGRPQADLRQVRRPDLPMHQPPTAMGIVRSAADLRQVPDGQFLASLPAGTTLTVTGRSSNGESLAVFTAAGLSGWVAAGTVTLFGADDLLTLDELVDMGAIATLIAAAMQPVELPTRLPDVQPSGLEYGPIVLSDAQLAVRAKPDQTAGIIAYLEPGQRAKPLARNPDDGWLMITFGANLGWIPIDSIMWDGSLENLPVLPQS